MIHFERRDNMFSDVFPITEEVNKILVSKEVITVHILEPISNIRTGTYIGENTTVDIIRLSPIDVYENTSIEIPLVTDPTRPAIIPKYPYDIVTNTLAVNCITKLIEIRTPISIEADSSYNTEFVNRCWSIYDNFEATIRNILSIKLLNGYVMLYTQFLESKLSKDILQTDMRILEKYATIIRNKLLKNWGVELPDYKVKF